MRASYAPPARCCGDASEQQCEHPTRPLLAAAEVFDYQAHQVGDVLFVCRPLRCRFVYTGTASSRVLDVDADGPLVATMKVFRSLGTCTCTSQCAFAYHRLINRRDAVGALAYNESINRRVTLGWCGLRELWMGFCAA